MQRAVYSLIDQGQPVTFSNLTTELGISRQGAWKFFRCQPGFLSWMNGGLRGENEHLIGPLARRMYGVAMRGSVPHGEFFMKLVTGFFTRHLEPNNDELGVSGESAGHSELPRAAAGLPEDRCTRDAGASTGAR
jgi:hypothetical protein